MIMRSTEVFTITSCKGVYVLFFFLPPRSREQWRDSAMATNHKAFQKCHVYFAR